ncbi:hypothetical protein B0I32_101276 [Nonomuraea fuscirosea]|uniref:Enoyl-CoA hydratase/isomerase-like protein n=1 Tax=Nonomuraea fuscirosea TaxID=1291556 RepID=A0A2T0NB16_9ACTN|nr:hypothetical protein B0I32_101276 [Nonomuraea fuscirosea]
MPFAGLRKRLSEKPLPSGNGGVTNTYSLLVHHLGPARTLDMLLRARMFTAEEAHSAGFVATVFGSDDFHTAVPAFLTKQQPTWQGH